MERYAKVGTNARFYFFAALPSGAPDSTLTGVSFTVQLTKDLTGNQATTGITVGVVSAANNPGVYYVDCSGSTSFLSVTGSYELKVFVTANTARSWHETIVVTSDGTGTGTFGAAAFTPAVANGRVTVSGSPLSGATVRILNSSGVLLYQDTTTATGLYNTLYFDTNGTYTINVAKSGYTIGTGTITVVGSSATGPGADIALTAVSTSSTLLASTFIAYARRQALDDVGTKADTVLLEAVNEAVEMICREKQWEFYKTRGVIELNAAVTLTISVANGSATCTTTGTWPTWAASAEIFIGGTWLEVLTRDSSTQVTLKSTWNGAAIVAQSATVAQLKYTMPTDLARTDAILFGNNWPYAPTPCSAAFYENVKSAFSYSGSQPTLWCIEGQSMCVWPMPSAYQRVNLLYSRVPTAATQGSDTIDWDPQQANVLKRAIDLMLHMRGPVSGTPEATAQARAMARQAYDDALDDAWQWDRSIAEFGMANGGTPLDFNRLYGPSSGS